MSIKLDPNAVSAPLCRRKIGRSGTHEGVKNRVTYEAKHTNETNGKRKRIRRRMVFGRFPSDVVPDLLEPLLVIGHPMGIPRKYAGGATVRGNVASGYFLANLDVYGGSSGSAVLNADTLMVEGILYAGPPDFITLVGESCDRSSMYPDSGSQGYPRLEFISRVTEFAPVIPLFDVYLGTDPGQLDLICSDSVPWSCDPGSLKTGTTYYWQVVSKNCYDQAEGPIWSFTTE